MQRRQSVCLGFTIPSRCCLDVGIFAACHHLGGLSAPVCMYIEVLVQGSKIEGQIFTPNLSPRNLTQGELTHFSERYF